MTDQRIRVRRPWPDRITTALWGLVPVGVGLVALGRGAGLQVDGELLGIGALVVLGAWMLVSALVVIVRDRR